MHDGVKIKEKSRKNYGKEILFEKNIKKFNNYVKIFTILLRTCVNKNVLIILYLIKFYY